MRTTLTLEPDVDAQLRALAEERGVSFKEIVNETLRRGLGQPPGGGQERYRVPSRPLGLRQGVDLRKALRLAGELEDEETRRRLDLRK